ncbi:MAG TPA: hypothetical protein VLG47_01965 [Candidatus Saccharimonadales bacterium]|nr:hypothetical protein [Candidatus Saccharimonadales bacterium]
MTRFIKLRSRLLRAGLTVVFVLALGVAGVLSSGTKVVHANVGRAVCLSDGGNKYGPLCLNRNGGGTGLGTSVIGWTKDFDNNEDFYFQQINMCDHGYVSSTCPFAVGSGFNTRYLGDEIDQIRSTTSGKCVGNDVQHNAAFFGALETCNDPNTGTGGGDGTIFIHNIAGGGGTINYVENRYWSNYNYQSLGLDEPSWLCARGSWHQAVQVGVATVFPNGQADNTCQWTWAAP